MRPIDGHQIGNVGVRAHHKVEGKAADMAEVLAEYTDPVVSEDGIAYRVQAVGAPRPDGLWEGWIEFIPISGGIPLRTPRETTQPNRRDAVYWATGLTPVYLEGALDRALNPLVRHVPPPAEPVFDEPAPPVVNTPATEVPVADAILDPYSVYKKGEVLLRKELGALEAWHLVNIIVAYQLSTDPVSTLNRLPASSLIEIIVGAVLETRNAR
jgi:hypothetical protein